MRYFKNKVKICLRTHFLDDICFLFFNNVKKYSNTNYDLSVKYLEAYFSSIIKHSSDDTNKVYEVTSINN
jgi:hypothetical protein